MSQKNGHPAQLTKFPRPTDKSAVPLGPCWTGITPSGTAKVWYYVLTYCVMQAVTTCYSVPYAALTMELSEDNAERDSATTWRMLMELGATSMGVAIQSVALILLAPEGASSDADRRLAYMVGALLASAFVMVPGLITAACVPERTKYCVQDRSQRSSEGHRDGYEQGESERAAAALQAGGPHLALGATHQSGCFGSWMSGVRIALGCRAYTILMVCFLATGTCFQIISANLNLYHLHDIILIIIRALD